MTTSEPACPADKECTIITLADLKPGCSARVISVASQGALQKRLQHLGLIPGTRVTSLRRGPLGDPTLYWFRGTTLALRRSDAATIRVEPLSHTSFAKALSPCDAQHTEVVS